jgi:hypothetical protein
MYFLEQVAKQLSLTLCSYDAPSENAAGGTVEEEAVQPSEQQQQ